MAGETDLIALTADIVAAFLEGNKVAADELPALIRAVHDSLAAPDAPPAAPETPIRLTPAQMRKSITPNGLVSFEDGKTYQTLKRHLTTRGLTVQAYKDKWGLPKDYPMTSSAYAAKRSALAKAAGLGASGRSASAPKPGARGKSR